MRSDQGVGKRNGNLVPGDAVELVPAPMNEQEYKAYLSGTLPARPERDFAVGMPEGGFLVLRDGTLQDWDATLPADLPLFDCLGQSVADTSAETDLAQDGDRRAEAATCHMREAVRNGRVAELRAELAEARAVRLAAQRAAGALRRSAASDVERCRPGAHGTGQVARPDAWLAMAGEAEQALSSTAERDA